MEEILEKNRNIAYNIRLYRHAASALEPTECGAGSKMVCQHNSETCPITRRGDKQGSQVTLKLKR